MRVAAFVGVISALSVFCGCKRQDRSTPAVGQNPNRTEVSIPITSPQVRNRALADEVAKGAPSCELYAFGFFENCQNADRLIALVKTLASNDKQAEDAAQTLGSFLRSPDRNTRALAANGLQQLPAASKRSVFPYVLQTIELEHDESVACATARSVKDFDASADPSQKSVLATIAKVRDRPGNMVTRVIAKELATTLVPVRDQKLAEASAATRAWILAALASSGTDQVAALSLLAALGNDKAKACRVITEGLIRDPRYDETIDMAMQARVCDAAGWHKAFAFVTSQIASHPAPALMEMRLKQLEQLTSVPQELRSAAAKEFSQRRESLAAGFDKSPIKDATQQRIQKRMLSSIEASARYFAQVRSQSTP